MINTSHLPELRKMLSESDAAGLREFCSAPHAARAAEFMAISQEDVPPKSTAKKIEERIILKQLAVVTSKKSS